MGREKKKERREKQRWEQRRGREETKKRRDEKHEKNEKQTADLMKLQQRTASLSVCELPLNRSVRQTSLKKPESRKLWKSKFCENGDHSSRKKPNCSFMAEQQRIVEHFVLSSPPGQVRAVVAGLFSVFMIALFLALVIFHCFVLLFLDLKRIWPALQDSDVTNTLLRYNVENMVYSKAPSDGALVCSNSLVGDSDLLCFCLVVSFLRFCVPSTINSISTRFLILKGVVCWSSIIMNRSVWEEDDENSSFVTIAFPLLCRNLWVKLQVFLVSWILK